METGTEYQLKLVRWDFFGTLTWSGSKLGSVRSREAEVWGFFRDWAESEKVKLFNLPIVVRWERGEIGDRPHAHFLLKQVAPARLSACFYRMHQWSTVFGFGFARIRLYHGWGSEHLAAYTLKDEQDSCARSNANRYEIRKFDHADRLCINDAAWRLMCKAAAVPYRPQLRAA